MSAFLRSYLYSYLFWIDLPLGALPLLMIYRLTGGRWGAATRKILEALADTLYLFAFLAIPILFGLKEIYPWMDPAVHDIPHQLIYLRPSRFIGRAIFYFVSWLTLNELLQRLGREQEKNPTAIGDARLRKLSAGGLVLFSLTVTFASVDWQMSVEPQWYSTLYGMVFAVGQCLQSYGFALLCFGVLAWRAGYSRHFDRKALWDMGNILLTLVILWSYVAFMQYLIIWSGNLPHEVIWFVHRSHGGWQWVALLIALFQFSGPFLFLLFRKAKESPGRLLCLGLLIFAIRAVDHYWMLMPGFFQDRFQLPWQLLPTWLAMGAVWLLIFVRRLTKQPRFAESDPDWALLVAQVEEL